jgi:hypothetical protein
LLEFLDKKIFSFGSIVSGHTLKHLAAAAASLAILRLLQTRQPIAAQVSSHIDLRKVGQASNNFGDQG